MSNIAECLFDESTSDKSHILVAVHGNFSLETTNDFFFEKTYETHCVPYGII